MLKRNWNPGLSLLQHKQLYGNEFPAASAGKKAEPDWIEVYNSDCCGINLLSYHLTNNLANLTKNTIEVGLFVPACGYAVSYADNDPLQGADYLNILLDADELLLVRPERETIVDS